ncbi:hypothetical protein FRZ67_01895 [Panacibacter ginsenosidivorans]|uniref:Macroglobulin domain-containing protein n=1 Tax=Panacibacter ginsenosidivorans TaxID=1813871 RepID=A0A5B8V4Z7_9BACT|nr:hypothetical protein [Panacibacter ginsenosidivorans]QEC66115.1 hypothetical protein FRZ67_01895 [Panacibacter ginsenosidivorans]
MFYKIRYQYFRESVKRNVLLIMLTFFIALRLSAQKNLNIITAAFNDYKAGTIQEKIYVHTDKNFYLTGEIIWFKLYNTDASFHKPLDISSVAYVEILDTLNKPVQQAKIGLKNGEGNGSFYLSPGIASGNYKLRAYTNWMKNFDAAYFFEKNITIVNLQKMSTAAVKDSSEKYDINFFAEGGDLINGLQSKVAFKATTRDGNGFDFAGYLLDNNDTLLRFSPYHAGMGNFIFTPAADHNYKAVIIPVNGKIFTKELPIIYANGYTMQVTGDGSGKINVMVQCNIAAIKEVYLLAHTRGSLKFTATASLQNGKATFSFNRSVLGDGISQLTVFNDQRKPVSERLYFKKPDQSLSLSLNTDRPSYETRKKVSIDIASANADTAILSMAVYMLDSLQSIDNNTIETYLLLTSDLKGYIEDPFYYFTASEKEVMPAIDNLMLTQGWRRFKWNDILLNEKPSFEFAPELNGHILTGRIFNPKTGEPLKVTETFLSVPGSLTQFRTSISDSFGHVKYEMPDFYGGTSLIAEPNTFTDSISKVEIDDPFCKQYATTKIPVFNKPVNYPNTILDHNIGMQVQNIYTTEKLKQFYFPPDVDTTAFYVTPDFKYSLDDYTRFTSMEEVLREYVAFVNVTRRGGRVYLPVINTAENTYFQTDPLVLLDGVPVFNFNKLLNFDPLKIRSLEVVTRRYVLGSSVFEGILNWKTYSPTLANYEFAPNVTVLDYEGLQIEREFYSPTYNTTEAVSSHLPDFRNVLQWKPDIKLSRNKKSIIEFYTSDLPGKYAVVVQGLSANGLCGSKIITFDVTK